MHDSHVRCYFVVGGKGDHSRRYSVLAVRSVGLWERGGGGGRKGGAREGRGHWERLLREGRRRGGSPHGEERAGRGEWGAGWRDGWAGQVGVRRQF